MLMTTKRAPFYNSLGVIHITIHHPVCKLGALCRASLLSIARSGSPAFAVAPRPDGTKGSPDIRPNPRSLSTLIAMRLSVYNFSNMTPATGTIALNNYLQVKGKLASLSWYDTPSGPAHAPEWTSECKIDSVVIASGKGAQKHISRDAAAENALAILMSSESS
ncbi:hypothetical protein F5148DRAFT_226168 [Russula earlei]|uniref:Uncharacterized protein n=1 Tax=Russula earlei TaxID=71964 RepID=A0ACC0UJ23_9AGAM|nr:hypothetical protein F5148DRAFT_226168 [Russula earlei]